MTPSITIAVQCHKFQRRFCWMLSSLAQQIASGLVAVDVACLVNNGEPSTEQVAAAFRGKVPVVVRLCFDFDKFQRRGLIRTDQLRDCFTPWIMFGDCDMVYSPDYFQKLLEHLNTEHRNACYMLSTGRMSTFEVETNSLIDSSEAVASQEVQDAFNRINALPKNTRLPRINVGAGYSQIINVQHAPHEGYYVKPDDCRDWDWTRASNYRSDKQFRERIKKDGGNRVCLPDWFSWNAIHLNHARDLDVGHHIEDQR